MLVVGSMVTALATVAPKGGDPTPTAGERRSPVSECSVDQMLDHKRIGRDKLPSLKTRRFLPPMYSARSLSNSEKYTQNSSRAGLQSVAQVFPSEIAIQDVIGSCFVSEVRLPGTTPSETLCIPTTYAIVIA